VPEKRKGKENCKSTLTEKKLKKSNRKQTNKQTNKLKKSLEEEEKLRLLKSFENFAC
jgi:hypothetical protein